jgi:hypothetical protein
LPRGFAHLQFAVAYPNEDFADALELQFYASPCAKADQRVVSVLLCVFCEKSIFASCAPCRMMVL